MTPGHEGTTQWADRSVNSVPDYEEPITWPDDEEEKGKVPQNYLLHWTT